MNSIFDVIVLGGGILGISCAYRVLIDNPNLKVAVIEKKQIGESGATQVSGGFIRVFDSNPSHVLLTLSSWKELQNVKKGMEMNECGHIYVFDKKKIISYIPLMMKMIKNEYKFQLLNAKTFEEQALYSEFIFNEEEIILWEPFAGYSNPRKLAHYYKNKFINAGGKIFEECEAMKIVYNEEEDINTIITKEGNIKTKKIVACLGSWNKSFFKEYGINLKNKVIDILYFKNENSSNKFCINDEINNIYSKPESKSVRLLGTPQEKYDIDPENLSMFNDTIYSNLDDVIKRRIPAYINSEISLKVTSHDSYTSNDYPDILLTRNKWIIINGMNGTGYKMHPIITKYVIFLLANEI